jgi:hypothetical protein
MDAIAVLPGPPLVELTLVELFCTPALVPATLTENMHEALPARVAPDKLIVPEPAVAVIVPAPHDPLRPLGVATSSPLGSVSVKATPVSDTVVLGLVMVNVRVVVPLSGIVAAPKLFVIDGGLVGTHWT